MLRCRHRNQFRNLLACYVSFLLAERISKILGITGRAVSTRMLGIILAALAVQFVIDGIIALAPLMGL